MYDHEKPVWASGGTKTPSDIPNYLVNKTLIITAIEVAEMVVLRFNRVRLVLVKKKEFDSLLFNQVIEDLVSKEAVCCVGGKVKH